jgi:hypothetical protein
MTLHRDELRGTIMPEMQAMPCIIRILKAHNTLKFASEFAQGGVSAEQGAQSKHETREHLDTTGVVKHDGERSFSLGTFISWLS